MLKQGQLWCLKTVIEGSRWCSWLHKILERSLSHGWGRSITSSPKGLLLSYKERRRHCCNSAALRGKPEQQQFNYPLESQFGGIAADINGDGSTQRRTVAASFPPLLPPLVLYNLNLYWSTRTTMSPACSVLPFVCFDISSFVIIVVFFSICSHIAKI